MEQQKYLYKCPSHGVNLNNMRLNNKWCDVTIRTRGKEFHAHKIILAANLKYFEAMLSRDSFQESREGIVNMEFLHETDLEPFIKFAYTGDILITQDNALILLENANYLSEDNIKEACCEFLENNLKFDEACLAYNFANNINCQSLKNTAKSRILSNFDKCSIRDDYYDFNYESLKDILTDGRNQPIESQKMLFEGIFKWMMHDLNNRKMYLNDLLSLIDMTNLSPEYLTDYLENIIDNNDKHDIIKDVLMHHQKHKIEQQIQNQMSLAVLGGVHLNYTLEFQFYNFLQKKWSPPQNIPYTDGNIFTGSAILNDKLYFISRTDDNFAIPKFQAFDFVEKRCITLHSFNRILRWSAMCASKNAIFIIGGRNPDKTASDQVLRYDPVTNSLQTMPTMSFKRIATAAIFHENFLYVLGGYDGSSSMSSVEKYDIKEGQWSSCPSMCKTRSGHSAAILNGKLYACGGIDISNEKSFETFDPARNSWQLIADMNLNRYNYLVIAHAGKLMAIGGDLRRTVELYDPQKDEWQVDRVMSYRQRVSFPRGGVISINNLVDFSVSW